MPATFKDFWAAYPRRKGSTAIAEAEKRFNLALKKGADPEHIVSSARRFNDEAKEQGNIGTPFIPMASTWLNQKRWLDYALGPEKESKSEAFMKAKGWGWNGERWVKERPDADELL